MMTPILGTAPVALPGTGQGVPEGDACGTGAFGVLVAGHLAALTGLAGRTAETDAAAGAVAQAGAEDSDDAGPADGEITAVDEPEGSDPAVFAESGAVPDLLVVAPPVSVELGESTFGVIGSAAASARGSREPVEAAGAAGGAGAVGAVGAGSALPVTGRPAAVVTTTPTAPRAPATGGTAPAPLTGGAAGTAGTAGVAAAGGMAGVTAGPTTLSEFGSTPGTAPVGAPVATSVSTATGALTPPGSAVTSQVFPAVPALVSRGEGTRSITLRLHPADLGEVRVTVTVRNRNVDVTLAAGAAAQEALRAGSGELRSLLDLAGSTTGQLVVRDLPALAVPTAQGAGSGSFPLPSGHTSAETSADGAPDRGQGEGTSSGRHARGDRPGDDTTDPSTPARSRPRTPAGLDLTL